MTREFKYLDIDHRLLSATLSAEGELRIILDQKRGTLLGRLINSTQAIDADSAKDKLAFAAKAGRSIGLMLRLAVFHWRLMHVFGFYETERPSCKITSNSTGETAFEFTRKGPPQRAASH